MKVEFPALDVRPGERVLLPKMLSASAAAVLHTALPPVIITKPISDAEHEENVRRFEAFLRSRNDHR